MAERTTWTESVQRGRMIVEAALPVFASHGYADATTAEVARVAGISQATIFKHFATKRELFVAVIERTAELVHERWRMAAEAAPTPLDGLVTIARLYAGMAGAEQTTFRVRLRAVTESTDLEIAVAARSSYQALIGYPAGPIAKARDQGQLPPDTDPPAAAWYFLSVGKGFNLNHWVGFHWDDSTIRTLIVNLFRGMGAPGHAE